MEEKRFLKNGSEYVSEQIARGVRDGSRTVVVSGNWEISETIRIPDHFTLILDNCHLRMADGCCANLFVNQNHDTDLGRTLVGRNRNISVLGRGSAVLDGGEYNGLSEKNQLTDGRPPIWKNNLILFTNVEGFKIAGIECRNQRWWAMNFLFCSHGYLGNLHFCACDLSVTEDGSLRHGLSRDGCARVLVKNADGIDLRQGCHDILIEHVSGFTEDDTVALTGLNGMLEKTFSVSELSSDLCNIIVRDVASAAFCSNVRLLNQGGVRLHHILIDGVRDLGRESLHMDRGIYAVRVGDTHLYGARHATEDETYAITLRNVYGAGEYAVALAGDMRDFVMYGIECAEGTKMLLDRRGAIDR